MTRTTSLKLLLAGASFLTFPTLAAAQSAPAAGDVSEVVVTGSRLISNGNNQPTPVTVVSTEALQNSKPTTLMDALNDLPVFSGSRSQTSNPISAGIAGAGSPASNQLNLRNLGASRTLVLFDGQRVAPTTIAGVVDADIIPQMLVQRVDTVTGGVSAVYGSDAVAGVVNYVIDKKFTGIKGEISGGETTYKDNKNWKAALSYGTGFANDRGHVLLSGEVAHEDGIYRADNRSWATEGWALINNPTYTATNGQPRVLKRPNVALATASLGGAIACAATSTCASLRGIAFGPGGTPYNLVLGPIVSDPIMAGGSMGDNDLRHGTDNSIIPKQDRRNVFGRVSYDVMDNLSVFAETTFAMLETDTRYYYGGFANNLTVRPENPYMPVDVANRIRALGLTSVPFGTMRGDIGAMGATGDGGAGRDGGAAGVSGVACGAIGTGGAGGGGDAKGAGAGFGTARCAISTTGAGGAGGIARLC